MCTCNIAQCCCTERALGVISELCTSCANDNIPILSFNHALWFVFLVFGVFPQITAHELKCTWCWDICRVNSLGAFRTKRCLETWQARQGLLPGIDLLWRWTSVTQCRKHDDLNINYPKQRSDDLVKLCSVSSASGNRWTMEKLVMLQLWFGRFLRVFGYILSVITSGQCWNPS